MISRHVMISGRVQGVWFRGWTQQEADRLGLDGWVRNRRDGRVEAVFQGPEDKVEAMLQACHQGPSFARVVDVEVECWSESVEAGFYGLPTV